MSQPGGSIATADYIRLECVKLAHRHDLDAKAIVDRAQVFEAYINSQTATRSGRQQKATNP